MREIELHVHCGFQKVPNKLMRAFDEAKELNSGHFKKYTEKLRSINPPCVPFLGMSHGDKCLVLVCRGV